MGQNLYEHNHVDDGLSCNCGHCHSDNNRVLQNYESKFKQFVFSYGLVVLRLVLSTLLMTLALILNIENTVKLILYIVAFVIVGYEVLFVCIKQIIKGSVFNENLLMLIASIVAFALGEYYEGIIILLLYTLGELLEEIATNNSRKRIAGLSELKLTVARLIDKTGITEVNPKDVPVGSLIEIRKGDRVPIDGVILGTSGVFDLKAVTGESKLYNVQNGQKIYSGAINVGESVIVKTTKIYEESTVSKIISLVEGANSKKAKSQKFISTFAKYYTPIVVILGVLIATIIPLFDQMDFVKWIYKGLNFIVISCPCALVISVPLIFFVGIGSLSKLGVLVKGSMFIDNLSQVSTVVFDKTGTLTYGNFNVEEVQILSDEITLAELGRYVRSVEKSSAHPIAMAVCNYFKDGMLFDCENINEYSGKGMSGIINGKSVDIGNFEFLKDCNILNDDSSDYNGTILYVAIEKRIVSKIFIKDQIKENARKTITELKKRKVNKTFMISGDSKNVCLEVANEIGLDQAFYQLLPQQKYEKLQEIIKQNLGKTMYVGDGINDTPSIALADVGVAMGGLGSESAIECADVVIMDDDIGKIPLAIKHSKKIKSKVVQNIIGSLAIKLGIMVLSVIISLPIWVAMIADVGVMLLAVANSLTNYSINYKK